MSEAGRRSKRPLSPASLIDGTFQRKKTRVEESRRSSPLIDYEDEEGNEEPMGEPYLLSLPDELLNLIMKEVGPAALTHYALPRLTPYRYMRLT